jgi:hypothetical protein
LSNDVAELIAFIKQLAHSMLGQHFGLNNQANPASTLMQLFQANTKLVNEIRATLSCACFSS